MKNFLRNNGILLIIIAVLLAILLGIGASLLGYSPLSGLINAVGAPFRAISTAVTNWTSDQYDRAFRYDQLVAENDRLRRQISDLQDSVRQGEDALREVEMLRDLLKLSNQRPELAFLDATVTQRSSSNWDSDLTLNRGSTSGAAINDCVIDQYGNLVGIITEIGPNWAQVTTVLSPKTELGGRVARTDDNAVLEGDFTLMQQGRLKLSYLPQDTRLVSGDRVVISALSDLYPEGIDVGTILSLHTEADGISRYAIVEPTAEIDSVRYVYIITDY